MSYPSPILDAMSTPTVQSRGIEPWSTEQISALAPDAQVTKAGLKLAEPSGWSETGVADSLLWGSAKGSGKKPYRVCVDLAGPAFKCSCPSRKFPCKHAVGLLHLWGRGHVAQGEPAEYAAQWAATRTARAEKQAARAAAREPADPAKAATAAKNTASRARRREQRITDGLADLERWLNDQIHEGLASGSEARPGQLRTFASRMVDAQAPGVASRLTALAAVQQTAPDWPERFTDALGMLHLLVRAWEHRDRLPEDLAATMRTHIGITVRTEDVLATPGVDDDWLVVGTRDTTEGRLDTRRIWLYGSTSGRWALVLLFAHASGGFTTSPVPGTRLRATAHFYPGRAALRAALSHEGSGRTAVGPLPAPLGTAAARQTWRDAVAADPWVEAIPVVATGELHGIDGDRLTLVDDAGGLPLIVHGDDRWLLPLLADTGSVTVAGELSPDGLRPLSVLTDEEVRPL